jgi:hypothetical protein
MIAGDILDGAIRVALGVRYTDDDDLTRLRQAATGGVELNLLPGESTCEQPGTSFTGVRGHR